MKNKNLRNLIDHTLIPHTAFNSAINRIEQCFRHSEGSSQAISIAIIGESRTGKTRVLEEFFSRHPARRLTDGMHIPILRVRTPSKPTTKGLAELMLRAVGDPRADKGGEQARTARVGDLLKAVGTKAILIDEFQHFYNRDMLRVTDWLKNLVEDTNSVLVVAGLPICTQVIGLNEQLKGRFLAPISMPRFLWQIDDDRAEFIAILEAFHAALSEHFKLPELDSEDMAFRCYCATGGLMGYVSKLLRSSVWNAIDSNSNKITLEDLDKAHLESVWNPEELSAVERPFSRRFKTVPTQDILDRVATIGTATEEAPKRPRSNGQRTGRPLAPMATKSGRDMRAKRTRLENQDAPV